MNHFRKIQPEELNENVFTLIGDDSFLLTSGTLEHFNTMTAAWGSMGVIWRKPVVQVVVRPTRYTFTFMEENVFFTLSFFPESFADVLTFCGTHSGRDTDKIKETGLLPIQTPSSSVAFEQARLVIECRKIYFQDILPEYFLDANIEKHYPLKDYHRMYTGEITGIWVK